MPILSASIAAGLLLAAIPVLTNHGLPAPPRAAILHATGATKTTAYKAKGAIEHALPDLLRPRGRPLKPAVSGGNDVLLTLAYQVRDVLFDHPGCVSGSSARRRYSDRFRLFVLDLCETHCDIALEPLADVVGVPLGTLKDWLRGERPRVEAPENLAASPEPGVTRIESVLSAWKTWNGGFHAFCAHVQFHLRIPFGRQHIADLLQAHGVRLPARRGRHRDASAHRAGFETFFPNAQWVGDGTELVVQVAGQPFKVNLELLVDTDTGAFTGASIRPTEDAAAVTEAFADGVRTTGESPLAVLLDNKPSNHGVDVDDALGDTLRMRSRPYVPTDKPHVEGAFGLFKQEVASLVLNATTLEGFAAEVARLVVTTWARVVNHRPRADRNSKSRVQLFRDAAPTVEETEQAHKTLQERQRRQEKARETRARRLDPVARARLDAAFERLGLDDPERHLRNAIASWPLDAIIEGIAVFEGKKKAGTLPKGVDGRYLRGIVKNIAEEREGWEIAEALLRERLAARDKALGHLGHQRDDLDEEMDDTEHRVKTYVGKAMAAKRGIDRTFWLLATADVIREEAPVHQRVLLRLAARRIHATFAVPHRERLAATRFLFAKAVVVR
ncbi:MAG: hypothetical protein ACJAZO_001668 [Myxococcota bacterium]|jgi:hypothetical protein